MSLYSAADRLAALDRSSVTFDPHRCLHTHDRFSGCDACMDLCPVGAIRFGKPPVFDADACAHCLACLPACPVGAFQAKDSLSPLLTCVTRADSSRIELVCARNPNQDKVWSKESQGIQWPDCLAGLGSGGWVALAALGLADVVARLDACEQCPWKSLRVVVEAQVAQAKQLLAPFGKEESLRWVDDAQETSEHPLLDAENPPLSRRDLFRLAARQGPAAMARAMEWSGGDKSARPGLDRMRVLGALRHLPAPSAGPDPILADCGFAVVSVSEACTACGSCGRACPTAALRFDLDEKENTYQITFSPSACIGCEICAHVCEPGAISIQAAPAFSDVFGIEEPATLHAGKFARCAQCNTIYPAREGTRLCPVCEYRRQNPFGSRMPAGLKRTRPMDNKESRQ